MPLDSSTITPCRNPVSGRDWFGADRDTLASAQLDRGYPSGEWATAHQWQTAGETVRAGERPEIVFWLRRGETAEPGRRTYEVFAREQLDSHDAYEAARDGEIEASALAELRAGQPTLCTFLIRRGGLRDQCGDLRAMDAHKRRVGLVRKRGGLSLDYAREAAAEAGYLPADSYVSDLLDAIARELRGHAVYPYECPF